MGDSIHAIRDVARCRPATGRAGVERSAHRKFVRNVLLAVLLLLALVLTAVAQSLLVLVLVFLLACEVVHVEAWISTYAVVARRMLRGRFEPASDTAVGRRLRPVLEEIEASQSGNVTVYSGFSARSSAWGPTTALVVLVNISEGKKDMGIPRRPKPSR
jgi:hypothetical protein